MCLSDAYELVGEEKRPLMSYVSGISVDEILDQLRGIRCASTIRQPGLKCTSCPDAIAKAVRKVDEYVKAMNANQQNGGESLEEHLKKNALAATAAKATGAAAPARPQDNARPTICPECGSTLAHEGGCVACRSCGYSKCG